MITEDQKAFLDKLCDEERLCEACEYAAEGCTGGVRGGPNGPIYPPCTESDYEHFIDLAALEEMILFQSPCAEVVGNIHDNPELLEVSDNA